MKIKFSSKIPARRDIAVVQFEQKGENQVIVSGGRKKIVLATGKPELIDTRKLVMLARRIVAQAKGSGVKRTAFNFKDFKFPKLNLSEEEVAEILAVNFAMADYEYTKYKSPAKENKFVEEIHVLGNTSPSVKAAFEKGLIIGGEVNLCRDLCNTPGSEMTPKLLAEAAVASSEDTKVSTRVLGLRDLKKLGMGGILSVGQGSSEEPKFIIMEYLRGPEDEKPVVLVGKGITFDTGGLNLKPGEHINDMHMDMSGGAAVIHSIIAAARLGLKKNIIALVPAAENMPSGSSYRPGDIVKSMSGKTIEIGNTDAEGRVVLADALTYAERYIPKLVVDVATLTGSAMVALGTRASAVFTKDRELEETFRELGEKSGDYLWPLPLWDEYSEEIKGTFADINNAPRTRYGGAIHGAAFLYEFAKNYPWVHIDMAPRMTSAPGELLAPGAAGCPVRLLVKLLENY